MVAETPRIRFFIATHKPWPLPKQPLFQPVAVGGYQADGALSDAVGDNISSRDQRYSELTAWYWIWKNVKDVDMVGLCHYRRYFFLDPCQPGFHARSLHREPTPANLERLLDRDSLPLVRYAYRRRHVIVPRAVVHPTSIRQQYLSYHRAGDWEAFHQAVLEISPEHGRHLDALEREQRMYLYNMMIAPWPFFADYMACLMPVLRRVDALIEYPDDAYQRRVPAFLAERFFTLHLMAVRPKLIETPVVTTDLAAF